MVALLVALAAPVALVALALGVAALHPGARPALPVRRPTALREPAALTHVLGDEVVVLPPEWSSALRS